MYFLCETRPEKTCSMNMQNQGADQMHSNYAADQRLWFRLIDSTIPQFPESKVSRL